MTERANFWAMKFISLVALEQLNKPNEAGPCCSTADQKPFAARSRACSQLASRRWPASRTIGWVSLAYPLRLPMF